MGFDILPECFQDIDAGLGDDAVSVRADAFSR